MPEARSLTVILPGLPPGPNRTTNKHWAARSRIAQGWKEDANRLAVDARNRSGHSFPWQRVRVTYEFCVPDRRPRDLDNAVAAMKPVMDGIRDARIFVDDNSTHVTLGQPFITVTPKRSSVRVLIECLDAGP